MSLRNRLYRDFKDRIEEDDDDRSPTQKALDEIRSIQATCRQHNIDRSLECEWLESGKSIYEVRSMVGKMLEENNDQKPIGSPDPLDPRQNPINWNFSDQVEPLIKKNRSF